MMCAKTLLCVLACVCKLQAVCGDSEQVKLPKQTVQKNNKGYSEQCSVGVQQPLVVITTILQHLTKLMIITLNY